MTSYLIPSFQEMLSTLALQWQVLVPPLLVTLQQMVSTLLISLAFAMPLAICMTISQRIGTVAQAFFLFCKSLPSFALAPLLLFSLGRSSFVVIIPTVIMTLFPLTISIYRGLQAVPQDGHDAFTVWGVSTWKRITMLQLPYALPYAFSGLRVAVGLVGLGVISGEWMAGANGLGSVLLEAKEGLDLPLLYVTLLLLFCATSSLYSLVVLLERYSLKQIRLSHYVAIVCLVFLSGCARQKELRRQEGEQSPYKRVRCMLDWTTNPNHIPLFYGQQKGLFLREGIELEIVQPGSADALQEVLNGGVEFSLVYFPRLIKVLGRIKKTSSIEETSPVEVIALLFDRPLNGVIAVGAPKKAIGCQAIEGQAVVGLMQGKSPSKTAKTLLPYKEWCNIGTDAVQALTSGYVDAVWGVYANIEQSQLEALEIPSHFTPVDQLGMPHYPELVVIGRKDNRELNQSFAQAFQKSLLESVNNAESAYALYVEAHPLKNHRRVNWEERAWQKTIPLLCQKQQLQLEQFDKIVKWLYVVEELAYMLSYEALISQPLRDASSAPAASSWRNSDGS